LDTLRILQEVFLTGSEACALLINAHTRKPQVGERANGRALLNTVAGSYALASVPRCVFVLQHASDDVAEERVVLTCCKNNDGLLGKQTAWWRRNGFFVPVEDFDWDEWNAIGREKEKKEKLCSPLRVWEILANFPDGLSRKELAKKIQDGGARQTTAYKSIREAEKVHAIKLALTNKFVVNPDYEPSTDI
jgi:hypothetical protein